MAVAWGRPRMPVPAISCRMEKPVARALVPCGTPAVEVGRRVLESMCVLCVCAETEIVTMESEPHEKELDQVGIAGG